MTIIFDFLNFIRTDRIGLAIISFYFYNARLGTGAWWKFLIYLNVDREKT